jgi:hypothetical protein
MGNYNYEKGVRDGKAGNSPDLPKENSVLDYVFQTYMTDEQLKEEREDYKRGYEAGSNQYSECSKKK